MIKISILYPYSKDGRFDIDYYVNKHMPMSIDRLSKGQGFRGVSVERGVGGGAPGADPAYVAMCHYLFDTFEDFMAVFGANADVLNDDVPNYTDTDGIIQISEVMISR